jgi:hypothetical protein
MVLLVAALILGGLVSAAVMIRYQLLPPRDDVRVNPPNVRAFRIDANRTLLVWPTDGRWDPGVMVVNRQEAFVGVPSWYGTWVFGWVVWHRGSFDGVWLRDRVKYERAHDYRFTNSALQIDWITASGVKQRTTVEFTH